jgi:uncharacterized protein YcbK (DUF882 family)
LQNARKILTHNASLTKNNKTTTKQHMKLTQKQLEKMARLVRKTTQREAVLSMLNEGFEISSDELRLVGIADPHRVIYSLRSEGNKIATNPRLTRKGEKVMRYSLSKTASKKRKA